MHCVHHQTTKHLCTANHVLHNIPRNLPLCPDLNLYHQYSQGNDLHPPIDKHDTLGWKFPGSWAHPGEPSLRGYNRKDSGFLGICLRNLRDSVSMHCVHHQTTKHLCTANHVLHNIPRNLPLCPDLNLYHQYSQGSDLHPPIDKHDANCWKFPGIRALLNSGVDAWGYNRKESGFLGICLRNLLDFVRKHFVHRQITKLLCTANHVLHNIRRKLLLCLDLNLYRQYSQGSNLHPPIDKHDAIC